MLKTTPTACTHCLHASIHTMVSNKYQIAFSFNLFYIKVPNCFLFQPLLYQGTKLLSLSALLMAKEVHWGNMVRKVHNHCENLLHSFRNVINTACTNSMAQRVKGEQHTLLKGILKVMCKNTPVPSFANSPSF